MSMKSVKTESRVEGPLVTAAQVAELLNCTDRTVRRYAESGVLPAIRIAGMVRFDPRDVDAVIAAGRQAS